MSHFFCANESSRDAVRLRESISVDLQQRASATAAGAAAAAADALRFRFRHAAKPADIANADDANAGGADRSSARGSCGNEASVWRVQSQNLQRQIPDCGRASLRLSNRGHVRPPHWHAKRAHHQHQRLDKKRRGRLVGWCRGPPFRSSHCYNRLMHSFSFIHTQRKQSLKVVN